MALFVVCDDPAALLSKIKSMVKANEIRTWEIDADGDFTHRTKHNEATPKDGGQWYRLAWMRPTVEKGQLAFYIQGSTTQKLSKTVYGVYHGRFAEMLLTHADTSFSEIRTTALGDDKDNFS